jgi:dephospho-CoA kinase
MIVGLTGGIATGKSSVGGILSDLGARVIDADHVAKAVVSPGTECLSAIRDAFGDEVFLDNGALNREALGTRVMGNPEERKRLEAITHPRIRAEIAQRVQAALEQGVEAVFVEAALLVETGSAKLYPHLWVVTCEHETQVTRLMARKGCSRETAETWIGAQIPVREKELHATQVIDNNGSAAELRDTVTEAYETLKVQRQDPD